MQATDHADLTDSCGVPQVLRPWWIRHSYSLEAPNARKAPQRFPKFLPRIDRDQQDHVCLFLNHGQKIPLGLVFCFGSLNALELHSNIPRIPDMEKRNACCNFSKNSGWLKKGPTTRAVSNGAPGACYFAPHSLFVGWSKHPSREREARISFDDRIMSLRMNIPMIMRVYNVEDLSSLRIHPQRALRGKRSNCHLAEYLELQRVCRRLAPAHVP